MRRYIRKHLDGGTLFLTIVTEKRRPILKTPSDRNALRHAILSVRRDHPFEIIAIVLLPGHFHTVMALPAGDSDYSTRIRLNKSGFTRQWISTGGHECLVSQSLRNKGERGIWQRRFHEHTVCNETDLERCCDYIHWNPVKHGLVSRVCEYSWSSFHRFVRLGHYTNDWGGTVELNNFQHPEQAPRSFMLNGRDPAYS